MTCRTKLWASFIALAALVPLVEADVEFTAPKAGAIFDGGTTITVQWQESNNKPLISELTTYQLFLCMGGNDVMDCPLELTAPGAKAFTVTGNQASGMVGVGVGASTPKNAYFLKMISVAATGGTVTNFSPRFSFQKMTGTFSTGVTDALKAVTGTDGPARVDSTSNAPPVNPADGEYGVDYTMQTGATRYAPMQAVPPTRITKQKATPLHPTSSVVIAKTILPIPKQQTTITQSQTFSVKSIENTAAAAPMPSDDMAKFLNRWKD